MRIANVITAVLLLFSTPFASQAQLKASDMFINAPTSQFPLIPKMKRMDMVDYYNSGVDRAFDNLLGGKSKILELTPEKITVEVVGEGVSVVSVSVVNYGSRKSGDSLLVVTSNVATPAMDGMLKFYKPDWSPVADEKAMFVAPTLADWISPHSNADVEDIENAIPFVMAEYSFDPYSSILTLNGTFEQYLPKADFEKFGGDLLPQLRYKWDGKKMNRIK